MRHKGLKDFAYLVIMALLVVWFGMGILASRCDGEDVFPFKSWYGVMAQEQGKWLWGFSESGEAQISVHVDELLIVKIQVYGKADPVSDVVVSVDGNKDTTILDYRLATQFIKGYKAMVSYTDANGKRYTEVFSLKGFNKGYKWLLK